MHVFSFIKLTQTWIGPRFKFLRLLLAGVVLWYTHVKGSGGGGGGDGSARL